MENWLQKQIKLAPKQLALQTATQHLTFAELGAQVQVWCEHLTTLVTAGQRVAVLTPNTVAGYEVILALQQLDCTLVLLNRRLAATELVLQLTDAQVALCLVAPELQFTQLTPTIRQLTFTELTQQPRHVVQPVTEFASDKVTTIMYTSGTTGRPKGVLQTFQNHFYSAMGSALNLGLITHDNWLCAVPLFHISGFSIMMRGLIYGMTVTLVDHFEAAVITHWLRTQPITIMSVVPAMLKSLLAVTPWQHYHAAFRCFLLGGGPIDRPTLEICQQRQLPVIQSYGMTETASQVVALNFADAPLKIGAVGKPLFPVQLRLDATTHEVLLKAPNISPGYWHQPAKTAASRAGKWFKTGDIGELDAEGFLFIKGRQGDMFISGGENIFPGEIEAVYQQRWPHINIVVSHQADPHWGQVPIAFLQGDLLPSKKVLQAYGRQKLAHYKVPVTFYKIIDFPTTASGKIQRQRLSETEFQQIPLS